jgi:hypothetical protein
VELAWHETGSGRPLILLPGFGGTVGRMAGASALTWTGLDGTQMEVIARGVA